jgi:hypothetical protein
MTTTSERYRIEVGHAHPLGAVPDGDGDFSIYAPVILLSR